MMLAANILEIVQSLLEMIPVPVWMVGGFILFVFIGQIGGANKKPTENAEDLAKQRERIQRRQQHQQQQQTGASRPPPLPGQRGKKGRGRQRQAQEAAMAAQAEAARVQAEAARVQAEAARRASAARAPASPVEAVGTRPTTPTIGGNARVFFERGGLKDAFILGEILGRPKSAD